MASTSRMGAKNWLPKPSPLLAPFTKPAMSTNSKVVGRMRCGCTNSANNCRRSSGTVIIPTLGSMVQKGKFTASALFFDSELNNVDLPTLGNPTIPHFKLIIDKEKKKNNTPNRVCCFQSHFKSEPESAASESLSKLCESCTRSEAGDKSAATFTTLLSAATNFSKSSL